MGNYLITGAAGGMGSALCRKLTESGDRVWGLDLSVPAEPCSWRCLRADITSPVELEAALDQVRREAGELDGIIHMAGIYDLDSLAEMAEDRFLRDFNVNLFGAFRVNRLFLPLLCPGGRILIVTSELAPLDPLPFTGIYAVAKSALDRYAAALRMELQLLGHKVIVIRPGAVETSLLPESLRCLERFCSGTKLYPLPGERFRRIVERTETRSISPEMLADRVQKALKARRPRLVYHVNRNPLLILLSALPQRFQLRIIRQILTK